MLQTIQGYFIDNKFISFNEDKIPSHVEVYVIVTNKPAPINFTEAEYAVDSYFPLFGCAKNKGGWISDDFDAPLDEMKDYI